MKRNLLFGFLLIGSLARADIFQELRVSDGLGDNITVDVCTSASCPGPGGVGFGSSLMGISGAGGLTAAVLGANSISISGFVGNITINSLTASAGPGSIGVNATTTDALPTGSLSIDYTNTTYSNLSSTLSLAGSVANVNTPTPSAEFTLFGDDPPEVPSETLIADIGPIFGTSSSSSGSAANPFTGAEASLTSEIDIIFDDGGPFTTTFVAANVPEPASILLLVTILLVLAGILRKNVARRS
jgi:hypothetical protein